MDLTKYKLEDFIKDRSFQNWVQQTNERDIHFWDAWLRNHPEKLTLAMEAAQIIKGFQTSEKEFSYSDVHTFWLELEERMQKPARERHISAYEKHKPSRFLPKPAYQMAAALIGVLLLAGGLWLFFNPTNTVTYATAYGERKSINLPDGSRVTLNGNSELQYPAQWSEDTPREVWLSGEGFFEVQKIAKGQQNATDQKPEYTKFVVHTSNLNVEVIGTAFNVNDRRDETTIVLESGKVKLQSDWLQKTETDLTMQPGELVAASRKENKWNKKVVNTEEYVAWRHNKFIFDNTTIKEIAQILEDSYGLKTRVDQPEVWDKRFTGSAPTDQIEVLCKAIGASFRWEVEQKGKTIYINTQ